jgi:TPR repeat protein
MKRYDGKASMKASVRNLSSAFAVAMALGASAVAGPLEDGIAAYHEHGYAKAAELWRPLAEKGDAAAQYFLGTLYVEGHGVEQNDATAFMWFQRAASQGDAAAQYNVGASYAGGTGVQKSSVDAAKWFQRAANQGLIFAQVNLGLLYAAGNGVPQDNVEALKWFELALFALPAGAARSDVARAMTDVTEKMTSEQIQQAKERQREWKAQPEVK